MPNWCDNVLKVIGAKDKLEQFVSTLDDKKLTLGAHIPEPVELGSIFVDSRKKDSTMYWRENKNSGHIVEVSQSELDELTAKYGTPDWDEWARKNWGTKWDIEPAQYKYVSNGTRYLEFRFKTATASPRPWLKTIGSRFTDLEFELAYAEGDAGFYGFLHIKNNNVMEEFCSFDFNEVHLLGEEFDRRTEACIKFMYKHGLVYRSV